MAKRPVVRLLALGVALLVSACTHDESPLGPDALQDVEAVETLLNCRVDLKAESFECLPDGAAPGDGASGAIYGQQDVLVSLQASNVSVDATSFSAYVTVRNFLTQTIGTEDGLTVDPDGVRVFFFRDPWTDDPGASVTHDETAISGRANFTSENQAYYQYDQILSPGKVSLPLAWKWILNGPVNNFEFKVLISTKVADEGAIEEGLKLGGKTLASNAVSSCAITADGKAYCWGSNSHGASGQGVAPIGTYDSVLPGPVNSTEHFVAVSSGYEHACALTLEGKVFCWGSGGAGQVGNGSKDDQHSPVPVEMSHVPGGTFVSVSSGELHTCALVPDGTAYCWGDNSIGQLGDGTYSEREVPVEVSGSVKFTQIVAFGYGQLANVCGLTADGTVYCWGDNQHGQLAGGTTDNSNVPLEVVTGERFTRLGAGTASVCGITEKGDLYCWGFNLNGKLGLGDDINRTAPTKVEGISGVVTIDIGINHSCAVTREGRVYCWGSNEDGKLGIKGTGGDYMTPQEVNTDDIPGIRFSSVSTGGFHTCASATNGRVYCWGDNKYRQLGIDGPIVLTAPHIDYPIKDGLDNELVNLASNIVDRIQEDTPAFTPVWRSFESFILASRLVKDAPGRG